MTEITVPREDLQILFDTAVGSMDFGSGFLDHEEVDCLRRIAVLLGVDPQDATPKEFQSSYPHPFDGQERRIYDDAFTGFLPRPFRMGIVCRRCNKEETAHVWETPA